jgi:hypothetical protein
LKRKQPWQNSNPAIPAKAFRKSYMASCHYAYCGEQGKIELDAPINKYLPAKNAGYIKNAGNITVRKLLNHTSGIPEYSVEALISLLCDTYIPLQKLSTDFVIGSVAR